MSEGMCGQQNKVLAVRQHVDEIVEEARSVSQEGRVSDSG